ncbi:hypothetical protein ACFE04_021748 [Oxalis oulophora]
MGKGGGCVKSKKKLPESDNDEDNPNPDGNSPILTQNQIPTIQNPNLTPQKLKIFITFYSMYGHVELLAKRMKIGVDSIDGVQGFLFRVAETMSKDDLEQMRVPEKGDDVPFISVEQLVEADGLLFGFPTRFGSMASQMKAFFDESGELWKEQRLAGVPAGFFVATGTQGGGQETTACKRGFVVNVAGSMSSFQIVMLLVDLINGLLWTAITQLVHHGMIYVPIGYTFGAGMFKMDSLRGGSPYGAGVFSGDGTREPSETELALAEHQGKYMATIVKRFGHPDSLKLNNDATVD